MRLRSSRAFVPRLLVALTVVSLAGCASPDERRRGSYDPRTAVVSCLREAGQPARLADPAAVLVGRVRIEFLRTPGEAEARSIAGRAQGAEQIGRALVWVADAPDDDLATIEGCVDQ